MSGSVSADALHKLLFRSPRFVPQVKHDEFGAISSWDKLGVNWTVLRRQAALPIHAIYRHYDVALWTLA
jgi:hypothetical protein